jgi:hypothetical protein
MKGLTSIDGDIQNSPSLCLSDSFLKSSFPPFPCSTREDNDDKNIKKSFSVKALMQRRPTLFLDFTCNPSQSLHSIEPVASSNLLARVKEKDQNKVEAFQ